MASPSTLLPKVAIVTGSSAGIGKEIARCLQAGGYRVVLACRSEERTRAAMESLSPPASGQGSLEFMALDLAKLASVRSFCNSFRALGVSLDLLVCNAGMNSASASGKPTVDGFDEVFAANYLGHFLLCSLLAPALVASQGCVAMMTSVVHRSASEPWAALTDGGVKGHQAQGLYGTSKLAQLLHAQELRRRLAGVRVVSVNPGGVASDIWRNYSWWQRWFLRCIFVSSARAAASVAAVLMRPEGLAPDAEYLNLPVLAAVLPFGLGEYYGPAASGRLVASVPSKAARDTELAKRLYSDSERWVGLEPDCSSEANERPSGEGVTQRTGARASS